MTTTKKHTTLSGHLIEYASDKPEGLDAFVHELAALVADPGHTEDEAIILAHSARNPLLSPHELFPDRRVVTKETLAHPAYAVVADLLARKHVATRGLDVQKMADEHTF